MSLSDQEQVILKAIAHADKRAGLALISEVLRAVGYPKATSKKILIGLAEKGIVTLHRHDYPSSLAPADRKLMILSKGNYYNAVSVRKKNPKGQHLPGLPARAQREYEKILKSAKAEGRYKGREKEVAARTVKKQYAKKRKKNTTVIKAKKVIIRKVINPKKATKRRRNLDHRDSTHQVQVSKHWRAGGLSQWQRAHHAGQHDLFSHGIKAKPKRNPRKGSRKKLGATKRVARVGQYGDWSTPLLRAQRKDTAAHLKWLGDKEPRAASIVRARLEQIDAELARRQSKTRNASRTGNPKRSSKKRAGAPSAGRKATKARSRKPVAKARKASTKRAARNPSPESIRKDFAGAVSGSRDLFFPKGTPQGLAKLGKLVSITTEEGTIKPVSGTAWLCADTKEKLHIGSTNNSPLFDGPARSFGKVSKVEYESSKPHLGYRGPIIWFHHMGEESGHKPTLHADGHGGLVFRGGQYRLTKRGIEN